MYRQTGLDDWSRAMKVWYIYQKKYLTPLASGRLSLLFRPFVNGMKKSKIITAIGNHLAEEEPITLNIFYLKRNQIILA